MLVDGTWVPVGPGNTVSGVPAGHHPGTGIDDTGRRVGVHVFVGPRGEVAVIAHQFSDPAGDHRARWVDYLRELGRNRPGLL